MRMIERDEVASLRAKAAGVIDDSHIVAEIGQVLAGDIVGRRSAA